jgi:NAD(P)-dependent dehydrogenase (short-subunit alcohol dehydrogenase family)
MSTRVLIVGGYGTFGGRLAQLLADEPRLTLIIAGRARERAEAFCKSLPGAAAREALAFDREGDLEAALAAARPDVVVDASGPFQAYQGDPYKLVRACIARGIDYLDLADASDFVDGIAQLDAAAKERGVCVLSGVSSFPVLTAAVVRRLSQRMSRLDSVTGGIAPSPYAGVGPNVVRAIASYAGHPVRLVRDGHAAVGIGLVETRRFTIAPPGRLPLRPVRFSLVDVPDLQALPRLWPELKSVWMGAGSVPEILHRLLNVLARGVRLKLLPRLVPLAPLMHGAINVLRWGEHRGGMFVAVEGAGRDGRRIESSWHMIAEGDDGPLIPSMAAEAIIRQRLDGRRRAPGARAALRELELADYEALFSRRRIFCGVRDAMSAEMPLYRRMLGDAYAALPAAIQAMHELTGTLTAEGRATVERGAGIMARAIGAIFRFPPAARDIPIKVDFALRGAREVWRRNFAGRSFISTQEEGRGRFDRLLCERFGPFAFGLAVVCEGGRLNLLARAWSVFGIPMPRALVPHVTAYEGVEDGRFRFYVEIKLPLVGLIVRYRGWLVPRR